MFAHADGVGGSCPTKAKTKFVKKERRRKKR